MGSLANAAWNSAQAAAIFIIEGAVAALHVAYVAISSTVSTLWTIVSGIGKTVLAIGKQVAGVLGQAIGYVDKIVGGVIRTVTSLATEVAGVVVKATNAAVSVASSIVAPIAAKIAPLVSKTAEALRPIYTHAGALVNTISGGVQAIGEAIHFSTLLKVHKIAEVVSPAYREQTHRMYREISKASTALGLGPAYLTLLIENSRAVWLDVSTMSGKKYDLAEAEWLTKFNTVLKNFSANMGVYEENPQQILTDFNEWVYRPAADEKARIMSHTFAALEELTDTVNPWIEKTATLAKGLDKLLGDLPEDIRKEIEPYIDWLTKDFQEWVQSEYRPTLAILDELIDVSGNKREDLKDAMSEILERLAWPGRYIMEIDGFGGHDRALQEGMIDDMASRGLKNALAGYSGDVNTRVRLLAAQKELAVVSPTPALLGLERVTAPGRPAEKPGVPRKTWYVGEY